MNLLSDAIILPISVLPWQLKHLRSASVGESSSSEMKRGVEGWTKASTVQVTTASVGCVTAIGSSVGSCQAQYASAGSALSARSYQNRQGSNHHCFNRPQSIWSFLLLQVVRSVRLYYLNFVFSYVSLILLSRRSRTSVLISKPHDVSNLIQARWRVFIIF